MEIDFESYPGNTRGGAERFVMDGTPPGDFLRSVLCNDLYGALNHADDTNLYWFPEIYRWWYQNAPSGCWGTKERYEQWCKRGGLRGVSSSYKETGPANPA